MSRPWIQHAVVALAALAGGCSYSSPVQAPPASSPVAEAPAQEQPATEAPARPDLAPIIASTARDYPEIEHVDAATLAGWMESGSKRLVLLDVREPEEFAVSHLRGAIQVDPGASAAELGGTALAGVPSDARIVCYCSVGVRSSILARRLRAAGYTRVCNLAGSIFEWANEGRPVYRGGVEVNGVHPFDEEWGELLRRDRREMPR